MTAQYWSNPDVNYPPTGQPMGTATYEDNARVLNYTDKQLRDFRTLAAPSGFSITNRYSTGDPPNLDWNAVSGAEEYWIYRCVDPAGGNFACGSPSNFYLFGRISHPTTEYCGTCTLSYYYVIKSPYGCGSSGGYDGVYYVTSYDSHIGESGYQSTESICLKPRENIYALNNGLVVERKMLPEEFSLQGNAPNPFHEQTIFHFALPEAANIELVIYDLMGRVVNRLIDEQMGPGFYAVPFNLDKSGLASGLYLYRFTAGEKFAKTGRMVVVR